MKATLRIYAGNFRYVGLAMAVLSLIVSVAISMGIVHDGYILVNGHPSRDFAPIAMAVSTPVLGVVIGLALFLFVPTVRQLGGEAHEPTQRETQTVGAKTTEEIQGYEHDWLASDEEGRVAFFSTAGGGYAPKAFLADMDGYDEVLDLLQSGCATTSAVTAPNLREGLTNTWKDMAERGIFSYDSDPCGGPYSLVGVPATPVIVDELPPAVAGVVKRVVLRGVRLGQDVRIRQEDIVASESD